MQHSTFLESEGGSKKFPFPFSLEQRDLPRSTFASQKALRGTAHDSPPSGLGPHLRFD